MAVHLACLLWRGRGKGEDEGGRRGRRGGGGRKERREGMKEGRGRVALRTTGLDY